MTNNLESNNLFYDNNLLKHEIWILKNKNSNDNINTSNDLNVTDVSNISNVTNTILNETNTINDIAIDDSSDFDKYIYDKIFTFNKKKIINNSNNDFMKNIIDGVIKKNKANFTHIKNDV